MTVQAIWSGVMSQQPTDFDFLYYNGAIEPGLDQKISQVVASRKYKELRVALITGGGLADTAYVSMRILRRYYDRVVLLVPAGCKSAGTLMALGCHELAFCDQGELGPLDVQMRKRDELIARESGANVISALHVLHAQAYNLFDNFLLSLVSRSDGNFSAKMATHIAADVTKGMYEAVFRQIDPHHLGDTQRAMAIGTSYGMRLAEQTGNIGEDGIRHLAEGYPSHGFVIDVDEAKMIFRNVRMMSSLERSLSASAATSGEQLAFRPFSVAEQDDFLKKVEAANAAAKQEKRNERQVAQSDVPQAANQGSDGVARGDSVQTIGNVTAIHQGSDGGVAAAQAAGDGAA
jgi:hypothetical protein